MSTKKDLMRMKSNLEIDNENQIHKIACISVANTIWHFVELTNALYHLACNDIIKYEIYETYKMSEHLRTIIDNGNQIEKEFALKMLWQLCFDERVADKVRRDENLHEKVEKLAQSRPKSSVKITTESKNVAAKKNFNSNKISRNVVKNAEGILWLLEKKTKLIEDRSRQLTSNNENSSIRKRQQKHIMISYNRETRELCLRVKKELESMRFKVWIDVENIHGSSLESMARAVENSTCVLFCVTEKYKMSPYCRAEAEYTFSLGKPFVPLIMQENYKPDGWLGNFLSHLS